jgi:hypothetical protein
MNLDRNMMITIATIAACVTAATLAWAVSHPCNCEHDDEVDFAPETISADT